MGKHLHLGRDKRNDKIVPLQYRGTSAKRSVHVYVCMSVGCESRRKTGVEEAQKVTSSVRPTLHGTLPQLFSALSGALGRRLGRPHAIPAGPEQPALPLPLWVRAQTPLSSSKPDSETRGGRFIGIQP